MRLIFVRHGEPDYAHDCLTETGREQARQAALRLSGENITKVYSSPNGRARETAGFTAELLGLSVSVLDFMHEIDWGDLSGNEMRNSGHPWSLSDLMITDENILLANCDWRNHPYFSHNKALRDYDFVVEHFDSFLEELGYRREGNRYLCVKPAPETVALFSHGGSGACALSRLLNLSFPYMCSILPYDFTSIIILNFPDEPGSLVFPRVELFNDARHIYTDGRGPQFAR